MAEQVPRAGPDVDGNVNLLAAFSDHDLIKFGRKLQAQRAELAAEHKKLGGALDQITGELLVRFNREKRQNLRTKAGLAYVSELHSTKITNRELLLAYLDGDDSALNLTLNAEWLAAWKLDHPGEAFPGTETTTIRKVNLRS